MYVLAVEQAFLGAGDLRFKRDHRLRLGLAVGHAGLLQQCGHIRQILRAERGHVRVGGQVVVAAGHGDTALQQIGDVARRIFQALGDEQAEQVLGVEVGGIDRVDVRAQAAA